ncbi:MAG: alkaline shock response membrane anchor protein AmaP [Candidatus Gygaella obscura]|nr:alkaline shock response membrane anchor protein AmaP [Candidatus Gygaella obscura]
MRFLTIVGVIFYAAALCIVGALLIAFSQQLITPVQITDAVNFISQDNNLLYVAFFLGIILIFVAIVFAQIILGKIERERSIAFNNPSGPVIISLSAIEDLIKRLTNSIFEIKESRPYVVKTKKALEVYLRITLRYETNIPELTTKLQELIKSKLQEILRLEDPITVKIHVQKIILSDERNKKELVKDSGAVPFQGYKNL